MNFSCTTLRLFCEIQSLSCTAMSLSISKILLYHRVSLVLPDLLCISELLLDYRVSPVPWTIHLYLWVSLTSNVAPVIVSCISLSLPDPRGFHIFQYFLCYRTSTVTQSLSCTPKSLIQSSLKSLFILSSAFTKSQQYPILFLSYFLCYIHLSLFLITRSPSHIPETTTSCISLS